MTTKAFDKEEIKTMIPHRDPFLFLDKVVDVTPGKHAVGLKYISKEESYFEGHFPGHPVMPGVLIVETMAQTAAVLVVHTLGDKVAGKPVYFMSVDGARFRKPVLPESELVIEVDIIQHRRSVWKLDCVAKVDSNKVAEATISAMIMLDE